MFIAELETRSFTFQTLGNTADEAMEAMRQGWRKHRSSIPASERAGMYQWNELVDDVCIMEIPVGGCLRDGEPL